MSTVVIVRHGDTFAPGETVRRIGARSDLPLAGNGRRQARRLARCFDAGGVTFDAVWCGPLGRHRETAAIVSSRQPEIVDWLDEIDHGPDEGIPEADVRARLGQDALDAWDRMASPPPGWVVDGGRRSAAWRAALDGRATATGTVLAVTSNGAARFALSHPDLAIAAGQRTSLKLSTGAFGALRYDGRHWNIDEWDRRP